MEKTIEMLVHAGKGETSKVFSIIEQEEVDVHSADENKRTALHVSSCIPHLCAHDILSRCTGPAGWADFLRIAFPIPLSPPY